MKYTKRDRTLAILICQIAAMTPYLHGCYGTVADLLGVKPPRLSIEIPSSDSLYKVPAVELAFRAWSACSVHALSSGGERDGAAECLLRDGWSPGEPVVRLGGAS